MPETPVYEDKSHRSVRLPGFRSRKTIPVSASAIPIYSCRGGSRDRCFWGPWRNPGAARLTARLWRFSGGA